jgi:hypothetical protein
MYSWNAFPCSNWKFCISGRIFICKLYLMRSEIESRRLIFALHTVVQGDYMAAIHKSYSWVRWTHTPRINLITCIQNCNVINETLGQQIANRTHPDKSWCQKDFVFLCPYSRYLHQMFTFMYWSSFLEIKQIWNPTGNVCQNLLISYMNIHFTM